MDVLERIDYLRNKKGWSMYKLANESGLTQSTLTNMFNRKTLPSITTLENICDAFGITMSEFFMETSIDSQFSNDDLLLLSAYKKLSIKEQASIKLLIENLSSN